MCDIDLCMHGRGECVAGGYTWHGGVHGRVCMEGETATAADGTHPTGMHSCYLFFYI